MNTTNTPTNIIVGLSGGVDSSVTAALLKQQGHQISGVFMQNWEDDDNDEYCSINKTPLMPLPLPISIGIDIDISILPRNIKTTYSPISSKNTAQAARQTRTSCAMPKSNSNAFWTTPSSRVPIPLPQDTMPAKKFATACITCSKAWIKTKTKAISCTVSSLSNSSAQFSHWASWRSLKSAVLPKNSNYRLQPKRQYRYLLYRRTPVPRISAKIPADQ